MKPSRRAASVARLAPLGLAVLVSGFALVPIAGLVAGIFGERSPASLIPAASTADLLPRSGALPLAVNTLVLAVVVTASSVLLGTVLAWLEQRARYPGAQWLASLTLMPLAIPSYLLAGTLREMLGPGGAVGRALGLPNFTGLAPAAVVLTLISVPFVQVIVGAALTRMSVAEEEAALNLGAGRWRCFRTVTLPRLLPSIGLGGLLVGLYVFGDFGAVAVLDCRVLTWRMFQAYEMQDLPRAAVLGLASLVLIVPFLVLALRLQRRSGEPEGVPNPRPPARVRLSPVAAVAVVALHAPVIALGVAMPAFTLVRWIARGWSHGETFAGVGKPLVNTLELAALGALVTVALAAVPAWVSARRGAAWGLLDQAVFLSAALPGILVATGLLIAALAVHRASGVDGLYLGLRQWGILLFAGYATRYLSQGFGGLKSAFLRLDARQEESARSLGAGPLRRWVRIVLPAAAPGAAAAFLLTFLVLIRELPITLVLQPIGMQTLSFRIFDRYQEAFLHDAGLAGAVLMSLALVGQVVTMKWRRHV